MSAPVSDAATARDQVELALEHATKLGASAAVVVFSAGRTVELAQRDGRLEKLHEADTASLSVQLYVDGRYSVHSTSDLRPLSLSRFVERAVAMTRLLDEDLHRRLLDPRYYSTQTQYEAGIDIADPTHAAVTPEQRRAVVADIEDAARSLGGPIVSAKSYCYDGQWRSVRRHSDGFAGESWGTSFAMSATVSVKDRDGRKPAESWGASTRHRADLPTPANIGRTAAERAMARLGQSQMDSGAMTLVLENRVVSNLLGRWLRGLQGQALQQERSFLLDRLGRRVGSSLFTLIDDPTLPRGSASRVYDGEGFAAKRRTLVERGILKSFLIGSYYANKMGVEPTGATTGNLIIPPGSDGTDALIRQVKRGVLVTGFLGGNSDTTRGDFSHGIDGFSIENGALGGPIGEMNVSGDHSTLWDRLVAVGDDPWSWGATRSPTLVFDDVSVSGR